MRNELADTLTHLIDALTPAGTTSRGTGVVVTEAEVDFPLEAAAANRMGRLVFYGSAPHTRWVSGVLPDVHMARLRIALDDDAEARCGR